MAPVPVNRETVLAFHQGGKVGVRLTKPLNTQNDLCLAYTPGVAHAVKEIAAKPDSVFDFTAKRSLVAVVSDGTAILGLGDLGAAASIPVMEGKAVLFKAFGDVDAWPVPGALPPRRRRHRQYRPSARDRRGAGPRADVRRHQPRRHRGPGLFRDRGPAGRHARYSGLS